MAKEGKYGKRKLRSFSTSDAIWAFFRAECLARNASSDEQFEYLVEKAYGEAFRRFVAEHYPNCGRDNGPERFTEPARKDNEFASSTSQVDSEDTPFTLAKPY